MALTCARWTQPILAIWILGAAIVPAARAQSSPADIFVSEEAAEETDVFESLAGFTGYGAAFGLIRFYGPEGVDGAKVRPLLQGNFRYRFNESWLASGDFGFGWNSFEAREDTVLAVNFGTISALREFSGLAGVTWRAGAGVGFYRWNYKSDGKSVRDPATQQFCRDFVPGFVLALEGEQRITPHITLTAAAQHHYLASGNDKYVTLFGDDLKAMAVRLGIHYHFSPYEGILWEREEEQGLTLPSGQAGP